MATGHHEPMVADLDDPGANGGPGLIVPGVVLSIANLAALAHPHPLVPAVLSAVLVVAGFVMAAVVLLRKGWAKGSADNGLLLPALVLFSGFAAAILCDADRATATLTHLAP
jgi:hypothetical protein